VPRAVGLTDELLSGWAPIIEMVELVPSSQGRFEVTIDGELIFSKAALGRHAKPGEVAALVREKIGPEIPRDD
jgi:selenoprotein W-related protein